MRGVELNYLGTTMKAGLNYSPHSSTPLLSHISTETIADSAAESF